MRYFPSAARQRATASVVGVVSLAALAIPLAHADDDLKHRQEQVKGQKNKVEGQIDRAAQHLEEASRDAARASRQYAAARGRLGDARKALARVTDRLVVARERDAELRQQLVEAEAALTAATDALIEGREDVRHQQAMVRNSVLSIYTQGDPRLRAVGALLSNASLEDLTRRQVADDMIVGRGVQAYDHLSDVKERLADKQDRVKLAAEAVEARKVEAAAHLETMREIYDETRTAKLRVDKQADFKRHAQQRAIKAKVRDRELLRKLKQREAAIRQRLVRLAELARARARKRGTGFTGASDGYLAYPANGAGHVAVRLPDAPHLRLLQPAQRHRLRSRVRPVPLRLCHRNRARHLLRLGLRQPALPQRRRRQRQQPGAGLQPPVGLQRQRGSARQPRRR